MSHPAVELLHRTDLPRREKALRGIRLNTQYYVMKTIDNNGGRYVIAPTQPHDHYGGIVFDWDTQFGVMILSNLSQNIHDLRIAVDNTFVVLEGMDQY